MGVADWSVWTPLVHVCVFVMFFYFVRPPHCNRAIFAPHHYGASSSWTRIRVCRRIRRMFAAPCAGASWSPVVPSLPSCPLTIAPPRQQLTPAPVRKGPSNSCPPSEQENLQMREVSVTAGGIRSPEIDSPSPDYHCCCCCRCCRAQGAMGVSPIPFHVAVSSSAAGLL